MEKTARWNFLKLWQIMYLDHRGLNRFHRGHTAYILLYTNKGCNDQRSQATTSSVLEFYRWLCAIAKRWWPIFEQSFKFAGVLWLLEWSSCEKLCLVGKMNQYASEWQQRLFECVIFEYFFQAWNRTGCGLATLVVHPLFVYRPCDLYESDSSPCDLDITIR
jgi:hypothetical protein